MPIDVVAYDAAWPVRFATIRTTLANALRDVPVRSIEHVGSTAVAGLAAKPILDVDVVVRRHDVRDAIAALERIGYEHRGDLGVPDRHAMRQPADGISRHVYVVVDGSVAHRNHVAVRDALRADPNLRERYGALKRQLAAGTDRIDEYIAGKSALLLEILAASGFTSQELDAIRRANRAF